MLPFRSGNYHGLIQSGLPSGVVQLVADLDQADKLAGARRVLSGQLRTIWELAAEDGSTYFVHLFRNPRRHLVPRILHVHGSMRRLQIPTFEVVAAGYGTARRSRRQFLVTRKIEGAVSLPAGLGHRYEVVPEAVEVSQHLARSLAKFISDFHRKAVIHGDLKSRHILLHPGTQQFYLVDLEKSRRLGLLPQFLMDVLRVRDLIQLSASCSHCITNLQKVRFLRHYLRELCACSVRRRTFYFVLRLYSDHNFPQGRTLLQNVMAALQ